MDTHVKYPCFKSKNIQSFLHTLSLDILLAPMASVPKAFSTHRLAREVSLSCSRCAVARGFIIHLRGLNNTYLSAYEINHSQLPTTICVYM